MQQRWLISLNGQSLHICSYYQAVNVSLKRHQIKISYFIIVQVQSTILSHFTEVIIAQIVMKYNIYFFTIYLCILNVIRSMSNVKEFWQWIGKRGHDQLLVHTFDSASTKEVIQDFTRWDNSFLVFEKTGNGSYGGRNITIQNHKWKQIYLFSIHEICSCLMLNLYKSNVTVLEIRVAVSCSVQSAHITYVMCPRV